MDRKILARKRAKVWYWEHRDKVLRQRKKYRTSITVEQQKEIGRKWKMWYAKNRDRERIRRKKYRSKNKDKFVGYYLKYSKKNPYDRMARLLRHRIRQALKSQNLIKNESVERYLGASLIEARKHLESTFLPGMDWNNLGKWHIDHIIPLKNFDLSNEVDLQKAFHILNLRALWAVDNLRKGSQLINK